MIHLLMADGSYEEVPHATSARIEAEDFVCRGPKAEVVARYGRLDVLVYSANPEYAAMILDASLKARLASQARPAVPSG